MNTNIIKGVGLIFQAVADVLAKDTPDFTAAYHDLMAALGMFNVHLSIKDSLHVKGMLPPDEGSAQPAE